MSAQTEEMVESEPAGKTRPAERAAGGSYVACELGLYVLHRERVSVFMNSSSIH